MHDKPSLIQASFLKVSSNPQFSRKLPNSDATSDFHHTKKGAKMKLPTAPLLEVVPTCTVHGKIGDNLRSVLWKFYQNQTHRFWENCFTVGGVKKVNKRPFNPETEPLDTKTW